MGVFFFVLFFDTHVMSCYFILYVVVIIQEHLMQANLYTNQLFIYDMLWHEMLLNITVVKIINLTSEAGVQCHYSYSSGFRSRRGSRQTFVHSLTGLFFTFKIWIISNAQTHVVYQYIECIIPFSQCNVSSYQTQCMCTPTSHGDQEEVLQHLSELVPRDRKSVV